MEHRLLVRLHQAFFQLFDKSLEPSDSVEGTLMRPKDHPDVSYQTTRDATSFIVAVVNGYVS